MNLNGPWKQRRREGGFIDIVDNKGHAVCNMMSNPLAPAIASVPEMKAALEKTNAHLNEIVTRIAEGYLHVGTDKTEAIFKANKQLLAEMEG